jgi:predicted transcriptional regulator of viral defense system
MDLKPYYDKVLARQAEKQGVLTKIDAALALGTPEGEEQALAMQDELVAAMAAQEKAEGFYNTLQKASKTATNPVTNFLPVDAREVEEQEATPKVMKLNEFQSMSPKARLAFVNAGGTVTA